MKRILSVFLSAALCLSLLAGCGSAASSGASSSTADGPQRYSTVFYDAFDTVTQVIAYCDSEEEFSRQMDALHADLLEYHRLYDIYNDYDGVVNVKTINDNAGVAPVQVDDKILGMLELARQMYDTTNGKLNIDYLLLENVVYYLQEAIAPDGYDTDPEIYVICDEESYKELEGTEVTNPATGATSKVSTDSWLGSILGGKTLSINFVNTATVPDPEPTPDPDPVPPVDPDIPVDPANPDNPPVQDETPSGETPVTPENPANPSVQDATPDTVAALPKTGVNWTAALTMALSGMALTVAGAFTSLFAKSKH